jgi:hypothetical protein
MTPLQYIQMGLRIAEAAAAGIAAAREGAALVQQLIDERRDPTQDEWETLHRLSGDLHARIQEHGR